MSRQVKRRTLVVSTVMAVLAGYATLGPVSIANAASLSGSSFEIDTNANLVVDAGGIDWADGAAMLDGVSVKHDIASGGTDDSFTQGTHEDSAVPTTDAGSIPPNKSDLKDFGLYVEKSGSNVFLNVFWTRVQDPTGTTNMDFEFNQSASTKNDPAGSAQIIPVRTAGDLLLTYDLVNGGSVATISKRFWTGSAWGAATALNGSSALGTINSSAITAANSGGLGALSARTFGEASVDLNALLPADQGCRTYGSAYLKSRSSASFNAELKDFIAPKAADISNCGTIKVHKTDANGALAGAGFTLYKDVAPLGGSKGAGDTVVAGTCTTNGSGDCSITDVKKGDYWLVETTVPAGHDPADDQHVSITAGDQVVSLNLVDPIQTGTITVTKDAVPDDGQDFTFSLDGNGFSLDDDGDGTLPNTRSFTVPVGPHSLSETNIPTGWTLKSLVCDDPTSNTSVAGATATISLAKNETVACTYTDDFTALNPQLTTTAVSAGGGAWNDNASMTGDGTHPVTGKVAFFACAPTAVATACTTGGTAIGAPVDVTHGSGSTYVASTPATYTPGPAGWTCFRAEFTSSSGFYADAKHTNATTECFLKQWADLTVSKTATGAFGRVFHWTIDKAVADSSVTIADGETATSAYTVTVGNTHSDGSWTVSGKITVSNPNPVDFTGVDVTDAIDNGAGACAVTGGSKVTVPANDSIELSYLCTYSATPSPATGTNTATAAWNATTFFTPHATATGTATVDFSKVTPSVTDDKVTVTDSVKGVLGTVDALTDPNPKVFHYTVERQGVAGTCTVYPNTATYTTDDTETSGTASKSVTLCVGSDLTVDPTGAGTKARDDLWSISKNVDKTKVDIGAGGSATFHYSVTVSPNGSVDSAYALSGLANVSNPNDFEAITATVTVDSNLGGGVDCTVTGGASVSIPKSGSVSLPYSCTFSGTPAANGTVTATATWDPDVANTPTGTASGSTNVSFAIGSETHKTIHVVDDKTDPANPVALGTQDHADGPHTYTYDVTKAGVSGDCAEYTNTASITETGQDAQKTVTVCVGEDLLVSKSALATDHRTFLWDISKDVDATERHVAADGTATFSYTVKATPTTTTDDGWSVTGQITVTNPNHWESITADVSDSLDTGGGASCALEGGGQGVTVPALDSVVLNYTCTFDSEPSDGTNTATATWDKAAAATPSGTATGTASVVFVPSSKTNETITVVDDKTDPENPVTLGTATWGDGVKTFTYEVEKQGTPGTCVDYTNTATISETEQSAQKTVTVCSGSDLTLAATVDGSFARDDLWTIDKDVDRTTVTAADGTVVRFNYTVTATANGFSDSGYALGGTVTVTNPNDWEAVVADTGVATDLGGGATCAVEDGVGKSVPAGGSLVLTYTCSFTSAPATTGTVTATTTWDAEAASTPTGTAGVTSPVTLQMASEAHATITVVDDKTDPTHPVTLGTADWSDGATAFTYSVDKTAAGTTCTTYTNTAQIQETEQSATQDVAVCGQFTGGGGVITPPAKGGGSLVFTGSNVQLMLELGLGGLVLGLMLVIVGRRRRA